MPNLPEDKRRTITATVHSEFVHHIDIDVGAMNVSIGVYDRDENNALIPGTVRKAKRIPLMVPVSDEDLTLVPNVPPELYVKFQQCFVDLTEISVAMAKAEGIMSEDVDTSL